MTTVLVLHLGPVQPFIAAARRMSDLQAGSRILSELAAAAAEAIGQTGARTIFPAVVTAEGCPNKVLALCPEGPAQARAAAQAARKATAARWEQCVQAVESEFQDCLALTVFRDQARLEDWCQFYVAWATRPTYADARQAAERLLDGRKRTRDFPSRDGTPGAPARAKSWQDAGREDVLQRGNPAALDRLRRRLLLKGQERLDALGAVKRLGEFRESFASVNDVAVRAAREALSDAARSPLEAFEAKAKELFDVTQVDAAWYFQDRLEVEGRDAGLQTEEIQELRRLLSKSGFRSTPYYALVMGDGDGIGAAISGCSDPEGHQQISKAMADFAREVRTRFQNDPDKDLGSLIYCGGDDVLAAFPMATATRATAALAACFGQKVQGHSLSAGIAVAHMLEPFDRVREWAQEAERAAKAWRARLPASLAARGALALRIQKRSGEALTVLGPAAPDSDPNAPGTLDWALGKARSLYDNRLLAEKAAYDLRAGLMDVPEEARWDMARYILSRKRGSGASEGTGGAEVEALSVWAKAVHGSGVQGLGAFIDLLLAGRFLHLHCPKETR